MVYIVDDDAAVRQSIVALLGTVDFQARAFSSGDELLEALADLPPGCILMDVIMPGMNGLDVQRRVASERPDLPVVIMTAQGDISMAVKAIKAGAFDFLEKPFPARLLVDVLDHAFDQLGGQVSRRGRNLEAAALVERLSPRERHVIEALMAGLPNKLVAHRLGLSPRTVEMYRANVMRKLEVRSLAEAVQIALRAGVQPMSTTPSAAA
jgi:two-component system response regulator FixJ